MSFPERAGVARLVSREPLTPRMLRVVLEADGFGPDWPEEQPGEIVTLLFAAPGTEVVLPTTGWSFPPEAADQPWRNYTVRRWDPAARQLTVDVVLHDPRGPACTWAADAPLGGPVGYAGPRVDFAPRDDAGWLLLCGDETAIPAVAAIAERYGRSHAVHAVLEVHDETERLALDGCASVRWVPREGAPAASTDHLARALREAPLPAGPGQVWGAAESMVAKAVRGVLRGERGLPPEHVKATGYWRRPETDPEASLDEVQAA